ncbi:hypothetical protein C8J56DRAFT_891242 [Mycena floridula]|nr:hypothetical protein C8J56DRAFT_891242 [Mycena floridula]
MEGAQVRPKGQAQPRFSLMNQIQHDSRNEEKVDVRDALGWCISSSSDLLHRYPFNTTEAPIPCTQICLSVLEPEDDKSAIRECMRRRCEDLCRGQCQGDHDDGHNRDRGQGSRDGQRTWAKMSHGRMKLQGKHQPEEFNEDDHRNTTKENSFQRASLNPLDHGRPFRADVADTAKMTDADDDDNALIDQDAGLIDEQPMSLVDLLKQWCSENSSETDRPDTTGAEHTIPVAMPQSNECQERPEMDAKFPHKKATKWAHPEYLLRVSDQPVRHFLPNQEVTD